MPEKIINGKHDEELSDGKVYEVFYAQGIRYLNVSNSADYVGYKRTSLDARLKELTQTTGKKLKHPFPGRREVYIKIEDLERIFFTPAE